MCGIAGILNIKTQTKELRDKALKMAQKIRHRGPDWSGIYVGGSAILAHERLSIVDPQSGGQPLYSPDRKQVLAVNGEIYNHRDIRARYAGQYDFQTGSDCEVILALYKDKGIHFLEEISGLRPEEWLRRGEEIVLYKNLYRELLSGGEWDQEELQYLCQFPHPLQTVCSWARYEWCNWKETLRHILWNIYDKQGRENPAPEEEQEEQ